MIDGENDCRECGHHPRLGSTRLLLESAESAACDACEWKGPGVHELWLENVKLKSLWCPQDLLGLWEERTE